MRNKASHPHSGSQDNSPRKIISSEPLPSAETPALSPEVAELIRQALTKVQFGVVQIIIQDGRVVQIDTTEKTRLP